MPSKQWFKLDTAGKMYSSIKSSRATTLFRLSADLKKNVDPDILQLSLDHIIERFPYFNVNLRRGIFWYYFDKNESHPRIEKETYYPCMYMKIKKKGIHPFRVLYYNKKVSVEFSHIITDGAGAVTFYVHCCLNIIGFSDLTVMMTPFSSMVKSLIRKRLKTLLENTMMKIYPCTEKGGRLPLSIPSR